MSGDSGSDHLRIGIVCHPTHGGSGAVATELGIALGKRGHEVHILSHAAPFRLAGFHPNVIYHEVGVSHYPLFKYPPYELSLANKISEIAESASLDLVHVHYAVPHSICAYLARQITQRKPMKIITTLHGTDITLVGADPSFFDITRFAMEESDGITAVSRYLKEETQKKFSLRRSIRVIHNFVDTARFTRAACQRGDLARKDEAILSHVSNFRPVKRVRDVVEVFHRVSKERPARLLLIGDGPDLPAAIERAQTLGISDKISVLGLQDDVTGLLGNSDIFLLPSEYESFGLAALEAISSGVPVIGTDSGGIPEVIQNGETGYLLPVGDLDGMATAALRILDDDDLRIRLCENGRRVAAERFSESAIVSEYESFYREILAG